MNTKIKTKWINALKSGKYRQACGNLRHKSNSTQKKPSHCCLGVLCDIWLKEKGGKWEYLDDSNPHIAGVLGEVDVLPDGVRDWAGLDRNDPLVMTDDDGEQTLSEINDSGVKFNKIANYIEKSL